MIYNGFMRKDIVLLSIILSSSLIFSGCGKSKAKHLLPPASNLEKETKDPTPTSVKIYLGQNTDTAGQKDKLCGWIDKSDMVIELSFADGVEKDSSYETGFYLSPIYSTMRLARAGCDYRVGFSFEEMKAKGPVEVGVRGYSDSVRRKLENEPIKVIFDAEGKPNVELPIKVKVLN
jgi:hypothetical protein